MKATTASAPRLVHRACPLCEAKCGIQVAVDPATGEGVTIRGDDDDPQSRGFLCPPAHGPPALCAVPDVDRTDFLLVLGANPVVSNGSLVSAPDMPRRLRDLRARGGKLVVVDPRRSETARPAGRP